MVAVHAFSVSGCSVILYLTLLEGCRQCQQLVHQRQCHAAMPFGIGMQTIRVPGVEIGSMCIIHRVEPAQAVQVDDRHCPHIGSLFPDFVIVSPKNFHQRV